MDYTKYDLSKIKDLSFISYLLHHNMNDEKSMRLLIEYFKIDNLLKTNNSGILTNLLNYLININDILNIKQFEENLRDNKIQIMKRDYLVLSKYYYHFDFEIANNYLKKALENVKLNTESLILNKDINFIIQNNLIKLIPFLENIFVESDLNIQEIKCDYEFITELLPLKAMNDDTMKSLLSHIEQLIPQKTINTIKKKDDYDVLIDGGNIIHSRSGFIDKVSLYDLKIMMIQIKDKFNNPLLIIHEKHTKTIPLLLQSLKELKIDYYLTPYGLNDDLFILWFFLMQKSKAFIISNDKYRDHIFKLETSKKELTNDYNLNEFNHIIQQQTLNYNIIKNTIKDKPKYSKCIQCCDKYVYIPYTNNKLLKILKL